jgi:hypothetical protein
MKLESTPHKKRADEVTEALSSNPRTTKKGKRKKERKEKSKEKQCLL